MPYNRRSALSIITASLASGGASDGASGAGQGHGGGHRWRRAARLGLTVLLGTYVMTASVLMLHPSTTTTTTAATEASSGAHRALSVGWLGYVKAGIGRVMTRAGGAAGEGGSKETKSVVGAVTSGTMGAKRRQGRMDGGGEGMAARGEGVRGFRVTVKEVVQAAGQDPLMLDALDHQLQQEPPPDGAEDDAAGRSSGSDDGHLLQPEARVEGSGSAAVWRRDGGGVPGFYVRVKEVFYPPRDIEGGGLKASSPSGEEEVRGGGSMQAQGGEGRGVTDDMAIGHPPVAEQAALGPIVTTDGSVQRLSEGRQQQEEEKEGPLRVSSRAVEWDEEAPRYFMPLSPDDPIEQYIQRHRRRAMQAEQQEEEGEGQQHQFVAFVPDEGFGNRLRGAYSTFLLSMLLDRTFLLLWTKPCDWSLQFNNTMPWDWDMTHYPALNDAYLSSSPRALYMCLTQYLCENRDMHRQDLEAADLAQLYAERDVVIVQDPDEYVSLLQANPVHGAEARRVVEWAGDPHHRSFVERFVGRFLEPSAEVLAMMAPYRGRYTHAIHLRSQFCRQGDLTPLLALLEEHAPYYPPPPPPPITTTTTTTTFYLALDKAQHRETVVEALRGLEGVNPDVLYIDLPPVHSNDRLPEHARVDSYVSLMADFFLLSEAPAGHRFLTDQSSFSEAVQYVSKGKTIISSADNQEEEEGSSPEDHWFCGRAQNGKREGQ